MYQLLTGTLTALKIMKSLKSDIVLKTATTVPDHWLVSKNTLYVLFHLQKGYISIHFFNFDFSNVKNIS